MFSFGSPQPVGEDGQWRQQLDCFVKENQQELAALSWGLFLEKGASDDTLGIDIQPTPRFIFCPKSAIEVLGFIDAHNPEKQVLILGIGNGQIKLIQFEIEPPPPICFEHLASDVDTLLGRLEQRLSQYVQT
jgi:hypothetical protein